jgi:hypothetical protein
MSGRGEREVFALSKSTAVPSETLMKFCEKPMIFTWNRVREGLWNQGFLQFVAGAVRKEDRAMCLGPF